MAPRPTNLRTTQRGRIPTPSHPATLLPSRPAEIAFGERSGGVTGPSGRETPVTQPQPSLTLAAERVRFSTAVRARRRLPSRLRAAPLDPEHEAPTPAAPPPRPAPPRVHRSPAPAGRSPTPSDTCQKRGRAPEEPCGARPLTHGRAKAGGGHGGPRVLLPHPTSSRLGTADRRGAAAPRPAPTERPAPPRALTHMQRLGHVVGSLCGRPRGRKWRRERLGGPRPSCSPPGGDRGDR